MPLYHSPQPPLTYEGTWNASTNDPALSDATGVTNQFYIVSDAGSQNLGSGNRTYAVGDWVVFEGNIWQKIGSSASVAPANPTAQVGLSGINGSAPTFMRSDAAPALNQAIAPTWTGQHTWTGKLLVNGASVQTSFDPTTASVLQLGTLSAHNVNIATNNVTRMTVAANGDVQMAAGYTPANPRSVATKEYVDAHPVDLTVAYRWTAGHSHVTGADGGRLWLAKYDSGSGHSNAPTAIGAASTYLFVGGREFALNGKRGIGFGYVQDMTQNAPVWVGYDEKDTTGNSFGDFVVATRNVTTNTAPTAKLRVDSAGQILSELGATYVPGTDGALVTKKNLDDAIATVHGGDGATVYVLTTDQNFTSETPMGVSDFSQIILADDKTEVRLIEGEIYISGAHEAGLRFYFSNINDNTITYNGSAVIPANTGDNAVYVAYNPALGMGIDVDPADSLIQKVTLSLLVTSTPTGGSYGSLQFGGRQQTAFGSPVTIHAGSKLTVRLISSV